MSSTIAARNRLVTHAESGYETFDISRAESQCMVCQKSFSFIETIYPDSIRLK